jgi:methionyl aminopeptidase
MGSIPLKSKAEIEKMRRANMLVWEVHQALREMVKAGVTTLELDEKAKELTEKAGGIPAFLNYPSANSSVRPFPGVICASRNDAIVHGIPDEQPLKDGDIISLDYGCCIDGFFGDSAYTIAVGEVSEQVKSLLDVTKDSLELAIEQCKVGNRIGDISNAVQKKVEEFGFNVVREFVGHGIGRKMHEPPHVPNFGQPGQGRVLQEGMVLAIEPMVTIGTFETKIMDDGWTAVTRDGSFSAHFEHTVAITRQGPYVLSRP